MKTTTALLVALGLVTAVPALADQPGKDWMPMDQVVKVLGEAGYTDIRKVEADDGHWEGKATRDGHTVKFHADAKTGAVTREKPADRDDD